MADLGALERQINEAVNAHRNPFATIDFDNTCIQNDIAEATLAHICKNRLLKSDILLPEKKDSTYHERVFKHYYELLERDMIAAYLFAPKIFAGFTSTEAEKIVADAIAAEGANPGKTELFGISVSRGLAPRAVMREVISLLQKANIDVWIVSASPAIAVQVAMNHFNIPGKLLGLRNKISDGLYTDEVFEPYSIAKGKVQCIKEYISPDERPVLAAGDSMNDFPMIEYANIKLVIDRNNALTREARARDWIIL